MAEGTYKWKCLVGFMDGRAGSCLFNFCYELCWNLDGDCIVFVDDFFLDGRFYHINPTDQWWWEVFLSSDIFLQFLSSVLQNFYYTRPSLAWSELPQDTFRDHSERCGFPDFFLGSFVICLYERFCLLWVNFIWGYIARSGYWL